jgi:hypothetical protein
MIVLVMYDFYFFLTEVNPISIITNRNTKSFKQYRETEWAEPRETLRHRNKAVETYLSSDLTLASQITDQITRHRNV